MMVSDNETFDDCVKEIEKSGLDGYFLAQRLKNAHNREMQSLRERNQKLEDCLHGNGLEIEDDK